MNENNGNVTAENEEVKSSLYRSRFLANKDSYYDFCSVSYNRTKIMFLIFFCIVIWLIGINLFIGNYDIVLGYSLFMSALMISIYFRINKSIKIGYERMIVSDGKEVTLNYELFEDAIVSCVDGLKREYAYHQITKFFETKNFILLHLKHNIYVAIEKNNLNASVDEVKAFLTNKCTLVKKKKFINCVNDKKWSLVFLIATIVVSVVGVILGLILKSNSGF